MGDGIGRALRVRAVPVAIPMMYWSETLIEILREKMEFLPIYLSLLMSYEWR